MKITKQELIELEACFSGLDRFITQTGNTDEPVEVSSLIGGKNRYSDLLWLAGKKLPKERIVRFACDCALLNVELIKPYTHNYDMVVDFLHSPFIATTTVARAAYAVRAAPHDAPEAAYAVNSAAYASRVAETSYAAYAAHAAAYAGKAGSKDKVNELLKELFA